MRVLGFGLQSFRGAAFRFYLVVLTDGTFDVAIWERHSRDVIERGVVACYHINGSANHPPFISKAEAVLLRVSGRWDLPVIPTGLQSFSGFATLLTLFFCWRSLVSHFGNTASAEVRNAVFVVAIANALPRTNSLATTPAFPSLR